MSTKERILEESLPLFAEYGYNGTSMEMIAERVGIKAPSLYKHYKGKEDILNSIIDVVEERYNSSFGSAENIGRIPESKDDFVKSMIKRVRFTVRDPMIKSMRVLAVQEQFRNERLREIANRHQVEGLIRMNAKILEAMMDAGLIKKDDPEVLALEMIAPVTVLIAKADRYPKQEKKILKQIENYIRRFIDKV